MAFATLVPPATGKFSQGTSENREPKVLSANLGDGYSARAPDGLNSDPSELRVNWNVQTWAEATVLWNFFAERKGVTPFKFQLPGDAATKKWVARSYSRVWSTEKTVDVSATFKEVFDPE